MEQRILIYGARQGGVGLRHGIGIADSLARRLPDAVMLLLASGNPEWMALPERLLLVPMPEDAHRLPPRSKVTIRAQLLGDLVDEFMPVGVVLDGDPLALWHELPPLLRGPSRAAHRPRLFLVVRDIDLPALVRMRSAPASAPEEALTWYDRVLVVGDPYAAEAFEARHAGRFQGSVHHVGWAAPRPRRNALAAVRDTFGVRGRYVLCAIGRREGIGLARVFLAVAATRSHVWQGALLVPPHLGIRLMTALRHAAPPGVSVQVRRPALDDAIAGAEVVVTALTDDAAPEALFHGRRLVAVHEGPVTVGQELRARALEQHDRVRVLPPRPITVPALGHAIDALLATPVPGRRPPWAHPDRFADAIAETLNGRRAATNGSRP